MNSFLRARNTSASAMAPGSVRGFRGDVQAREKAQAGKPEKLSKLATACTDIRISSQGEERFDHRRRRSRLRVKRNLTSV
jgi:hypothetical protein